MISTSIKNVSYLHWTDDGDDKPYYQCISFDYLDYHFEILNDFIYIDKVIPYIQIAIYYFWHNMEMGTCTQTKVRVYWSKKSLDKFILDIPHNDSDKLKNKLSKKYGDQQRTLF